MKLGNCFHYEVDVTLNMSQVVLKIILHPSVQALQSYLSLVLDFTYELNLDNNCL